MSFFASEAFSLALAVSYSVTVIVAAVSLAAGISCAAVAVKLIRRQIKLHNSIRLVELKSAKIHYVFFFILVFVFIILTSLALMGGFPMETDLLQAAYQMERWQIFAALASLLFLLLSVGFLLVMLFAAKSAVVDKGVYTAFQYLDWYHVHDYIIDESKGVVILSTSKETFATIRGTTSPLRVLKNDIPKLKFILNKNKNKFSSI